MITKQCTYEDFGTWLNQDPESSYYQQFNYDGAKALWDYLEQLSDELEQPMEFDPIAWCVEFTQYDSLSEFNADYNSANPFDSWEQVAENITVIELDNGGAIVGEF